MVRKIIHLIILTLILLTCKTEPEIILEKEIPGLETIKRLGKKIDSIGLFSILFETVKKLSNTKIDYSELEELLNSQNNEKVFIIEEIEYNEEGLAINIKGHVEMPSTYKEYLIKGGLGIPVYEAIPPNDFGIVFGRKGEIAIRDGIIVKENVLEKEDFYEIQTGSEIYDEINRLALLSKLNIIIRNAFLKNYITELEGMLLNSSSKKAIIESIKKYKRQKRNINKTNEDLLLDFLISNKSYLEEIKKSNKEAKERIKKSRELLTFIDNIIAHQSFNIAKIFTQLTFETLYLIFFSNQQEALYLINKNIYKNLPKNLNITKRDLNEIRRYSDYITKKTKYFKNINKQLEKKIYLINKEILFK